MTENENLVKAKYDMSFDCGSFKKNKIYKYRYNIDHDEVFVTTEENRECGQPQRWSAALSFPYIFLR